MPFTGPPTTILPWSAPSTLTLLYVPHLSRYALECRTFPLMRCAFGQDVSAGESSMVKIPLAKPMTSNQVLSVPVAIKSARWSGLGCGRDGGCVLGVVVSDGRALLFSQAPVPPARWTLSENVSDTLGLNDVEALDWSPSVSDLFALGLTRGSVMLLRRQRDATLAKLASVDTPRPVSDMRFSATRLAVVTSDCTVHVYNVINEG